MEKRIIFFDIDGTLLNENKKLPASTKKAVHRLQELGHEVAIATGRAPFMFDNLRDELGIKTYVSFNGSYVVHNGTPVFVNPLDREELQLMQKYAAEKQNPIIFENHEKMYQSVEFHPHIEEAIGSLKIADAPIYHPHFHKNNQVIQSLLFCKGEEEAEYRTKFSKFEFVRWHEYSVDVLPVGGSKARGIEALINHLNIPIDRVYAFGDGLNDIEMLSFVKNSVAMGNAEDEVKEAAKFVTNHVDEDGILKGLQLVGLLEEKAV